MLVSYRFSPSSGASPSSFTHSAMFFIRLPSLKGSSLLPDLDLWVLSLF